MTLSVLRLNKYEFDESFDWKWFYFFHFQELIFITWACFNQLDEFAVDWSNQWFISLLLEYSNAFETVTFIDFLVRPDKTPIYPNILLFIKSTHFFSSSERKTSLIMPGSFSFLAFVCLEENSATQRMTSIFTFFDLRSILKVKRNCQ